MPRQIRASVDTEIQVVHLSGQAGLIASLLFLYEAILWLLVAVPYQPIATDFKLLLVKRTGMKSRCSALRLRMLLQITNVRRAHYNRAA